MSFSEMSMKCKALTVALPEIKDLLSALEASFLKQAVEQQNDSARPTLEQRRVRVAQWPDILSKLDQAARRRESGLSVDISALRNDLDVFNNAYESAFVEKDCQQRGPTWVHRLRQVLVLGQPHDVTPITAKPWMSKLGSYNPLAWDETHLLRVEKMIARSDRNSKRNLDEILLASFLAKSLCQYGSLRDFLMHATSNVSSQWQWICDDGAKCAYRDIIETCIDDINRLADPVLVILWSHPRIWRSIPEADDTAQAIIDAILACCASIRLLARERAVFPEDNTTFIAMQQAVEHARKLSHQMCDQVDESFPGLVQYRPYNIEDAWSIGSTILLDLRFGKVSLDPPPSIKHWIYYFFGVQYKVQLTEPLFFRRVFDWYHNPPQAG